jgi:hypothetical protein
MKLSQVFLPLLIIVSALSFSALAHDPNKPHTNQGLISPYNDAPPEVPLSADEMKTVISGTPIYKTIQSTGGGRSTAVFKVKAPSQAIWNLISNFEKYPEWIGGKLESTNVYHRDGDRIFVEFTLNLGWPIGRYTYYVEHNYPMGRRGWATWKLDYSRLSDFDDNVGFWRVRDIANGESLVTYSVDLRISNKVPDFVKNMIVNNGLKEATQWVKRVAEGR